MQEIVGGIGDDTAFAAFISDWQGVLQQRVTQAVGLLAALPMIEGIILAGGLGRGAPWPLSDIDLLLIHADSADDAATRAALDNAVDEIRQALLPEWLAQGWWSGLDAGRLAFSVSEVRTALQVPPAEAATRGLLDEARWYHSVDKGYGGRAVFDRTNTGQPAALADWLTAARFAPATVAQRITTTRQQVHATLQWRNDAIAAGDVLLATFAQRDLVKWVVTHQLERWGERDASQARIGTRFERLARQHGMPELIDTLRRWSGLDDDAVLRRMNAAPDWVHLRHDRSLRARRLTGEPLTPLEDARDVLRVGALYGMREFFADGAAGPPYPAWLAIPDDVAALASVDEALLRQSLAP